MFKKSISLPNIYLSVAKSYITSDISQNLINEKVRKMVCFIMKFRFQSLDILI